MFATSRKVSTVAERRSLVRRQACHARLTMIARQVYLVCMHSADARTQTPRKDAIFYTQIQSIRTTSRPQSISRNRLLIATMLVSWRVDRATSYPNSATWCARKWRPITTYQTTMQTSVSSLIRISICSQRSTRPKSGAALIDIAVSLVWAMASWSKSVSPHSPCRQP